VRARAPLEMVRRELMSSHTAASGGLMSTTPDETDVGRGALALSPPPRWPPRPKGPVDPKRARRALLRPPLPVTSVDVVLVFPRSTIAP